MRLFNSHRKTEKNHGDENNLKRRLRLEGLEDRIVLAAFTVDSITDSGPGSLRQAILDANDLPGADTIRFAPSVRGEEIVLTSGELTITDHLTIRGPGSGKLTISGGNGSRVFTVDTDPGENLGLPDTPPINVEIRGLTIADGLATDAPGFPVGLFPTFTFGGGLYNRGNDVTLVGVQMEDNQAGGVLLPMRGSGQNATYDQVTGEYGGPLGESNLGPLSVAGTVESIDIKFFEPNPTMPGEVFFRADFAGSQTITDDNGDELIGTFAGEVVFKLGDAGTPEAGLPVGQWDAVFTVNPNDSNGRFAGATGDLDIVATNPAGFDPDGATLPFDWTIDGELNRPAALAAGGAIGNEFGGSVKIRKSGFDSNSATGVVLGVGGAISQDIGPTLDGSGTGSPSIVITHSSFRSNRAEALFSDPANSGDFAPFAGWALGGRRLIEAGNLSVSHTSFHDNEVQGGLGVIDVGPSVGNGGAALGGAVFSTDFTPFDSDGVPGRDSETNIRFSRFVGNEVEGGQGVGSGVGGHAYGGGVAFSISFFPEMGVVSHSRFNGNMATGGDGGASGPGGDGIGGAVASTGGAAADIKFSHFTRNYAMGGDGGGSAAGGDGLGGAVGVPRLVTAVPVPDFERPGHIDIRRSSFRFNVAAGGIGGDDAGVGGNGMGGAIGIDSGSTANVSRSLLLRNQARGGLGGEFGGDGGMGQGGGLFNGSESLTELSRNIVFSNLAVGGMGQLGGSDGLGQGGGLFNADDGELEADFLTLLLTRFNEASDEGDNVFGL